MHLPEENNVEVQRNTSLIKQLHQNENRETVAKKENYEESLVKAMW